MQNRYYLYQRRSTGIYFIQDRIAKKHESLRTRDMVSRGIIQDELPKVIINLLPTVVLQQRNNLLNELGFQHFSRVV